jgi:hypothetical protein
MDKIVICYAEGHPDGKWEAVCLDYDIAVAGRSLDDVISELRKAIAGYMTYAEALPEKDRARFLNRRVPFLARLKFLYWAIMALFFHGNRDHLQRHEFTLPCHA